MLKDLKIYVAGHNGLVGSSIVRRLSEDGYSNLVYRDSEELDLRNQGDVNQFFSQERPDYVFHAAARVGGIQANNTYRADFISENLRIQTNVIQSAHDYGVKGLLFFGSNCMYPRECKQPMNEADLLTGPLEPTNEPYAVAKIAGQVMCTAFREQYGDNFNTAIPACLYGPNDHFDINNSHLIPALLRKFHDAKVQGREQVELWGTGRPRREFMYIEDLADASVFLMQNYSSGAPINIGGSIDYSVAEIAAVIKKMVGFDGEITYDTSRPDGMMRKLLDSSRIAQMGWKPKTNLEDGLKKTYDYFLEHVEKGDLRK